MPDSTSQLVVDTSGPTQSTLVVTQDDGISALVVNVRDFNASFMDSEAPVDNTQEPIGGFDLVWGSSGFPVTGGSTVYFLTIVDTAEEAIRIPIAACTMSDLIVGCSVAPGSGQSFTYTVMKNGVATALTATINGSGTSSSDLSNTVVFSFGDTISIRLVSSSLASLSYHSFSAKIE